MAEVLLCANLGCAAEAALAVTFKANVSGNAVKVALCRGCATHLDPLNAEPPSPAAFDASVREQVSKAKDLAAAVGNREPAKPPPDPARVRSVAKRAVAAVADCAGCKHPWTGHKNASGVYDGCFCGCTEKPT